MATIADTALVAVFDPTTGKVSKSTFAALKQAVMDSITVPAYNIISDSFYNVSLTDAGHVSARKLNFTAAGGNFDRTYLKEIMERGDAIFISFYAKSNKAVNVGVDVCDSAQKTVNISTEWQKYEILTSRGGAQLGVKAFLDFSMSPVDSTAEVYISNIFVSAGNVKVNWGGVIYCSSMCYDSTAIPTFSAEKGGQHDEDEGFDQRAAERRDDRCNGNKRRLRRLRYLQGEWHLLADCRYKESTNSGNRNCRGDLPRKCSIPKGHPFRGSLHLHEINDSERLGVAGLAHLQSFSRLANGKEVAA